MLMAVAEPVFIVSPRYADEVASASTDLGAVPSIERRPERAAERFETEPARVIVIDARGAAPRGSLWHAPHSFRSLAGGGRKRG